MQLEVNKSNKRKRKNLNYRRCRIALEGTDLTVDLQETITVALIILILKPMTRTDLDLELPTRASKEVRYLKVIPQQVPSSKATTPSMI